MVCRPLPNTCDYMCQKQKIPIMKNFYRIYPRPSCLVPLCSSYLSFYENQLTICYIWDNIIIHTMDNREREVDGHIFLLSYAL